jgi:hypothetical protein
MSRLSTKLSALLPLPLPNMLDCKQEKTSTRNHTKGEVKGSTSIWDLETSENIPSLLHESSVVS